MSKDLIFIKWVDSHSPNFNGWVNEDEINNCVLTIFTVGWVIYEDDKIITVASQISAGDDSDSVAGVITIPRVAINDISMLCRCSYDT